MVPTAATVADMIAINGVCIRTYMVYFFDNNYNTSHIYAKLKYW